MPSKLNQVQLDRYKEILQPFIHLWKTDDKEWIKKRQADWKIIEAFGLNEYPKSELRLLKKYFLSGERTAYMPAEDLFFLTPIDSEKCAREFFYSENFGNPERTDRLLMNYPLDVLVYGEGVNWKNQHVQYFANGVLSDIVSKLETKNFDDRVKTKIIKSMSWFCYLYLQKTLELLIDTPQYSGLIFYWDYFVYALPYATRLHKHLKQDKVEEIFSQMDKVLSENTANPEVIAFAKKLKDNEELIKPYLFLPREI